MDQTAIFSRISSEIFAGPSRFGATFFPEPSSLSIVFKMRDAFHCVVVRRNVRREEFGVGVAVADAVERNLEFCGFENGNVVADGIEHEDGVRNARHFLHTGERGVQLREFLPEFCLLLLRVLLDFPSLEAVFKVEVVLESPLQRAPIREESRSTSSSPSAGSGKSRGAQSEGYSAASSKRRGWSSLHPAIFSEPRRPAPDGSSSE